jgi:hypothetical protein
VLWEVQVAVLILLLLYTFSRSESPCAASYSGVGAFDPSKHLRVCDLRGVVGQPFPHVRVRLKVIKQDQRMERSAACGGEGDWVYVGPVQDNNLNLLWWLQVLFSLHKGPRAPEGPFFVSVSRPGAAYLYRDALKDARRLYARVVGEQEAAKLGLHGLRVEGWNRTSKHNKPLAIAQGGWEPDAGAYDRYDRFELSAVLGVPALICGEGESADMPSQAVVAHDSAPLPRSSAEAAISPPPRSAGGSRLGSARRGGPAHRARPSASPHVRPEKGDRIRVWWTEEGQWFTASVLSGRRQPLTRVQYDAVGEWQSHVETHDLATETWEPLG